MIIRTNARSDYMPSNTNITREIDIALIRKQEVACPACGKEKLQSRYIYKNQNVEYKCPECKTIYHPARLI